MGLPWMKLVSIATAKGLMFQRMDCSMTNRAPPGFWISFGRKPVRAIMLAISMASRMLRGIMAAAPMGALLVGVSAFMSCHLDSERAPAVATHPAFDRGAHLQGFLDLGLVRLLLRHRLQVLRRGQ